jgi:large subunit ribosomal protein L16
MRFPKKVKHRKWQKKRLHPDKIGVATRGNKLNFGSYGLKAMSYGRIRSNQIEASRKVISRSLAKTGKTWIRLFPDRPWREKPPEVPMGSGTGDPQGFEAEVLPGRVMFEIDGVSREAAEEALRKAGAKLPVKTKFVVRDEL